MVCVHQCHSDDITSVVNADMVKAEFSSLADGLALGTEDQQMSPRGMMHPISQATDEMEELLKNRKWSKVLA